ncbi:hypothetical protein AYI68_g4321 [Smittium mucronatum]|uniref:Uncharacterized protein n=1 Tax=Smittium mucronatum TaxID=133383 RepID=A0A1R0GXF2_9FUNG|nr:hypothetical protein AYI68_g4321 [Smittium mucronatum]
MIIDSRYMNLKVFSSNIWDLRREETKPFTLGRMTLKCLAIFIGKAQTMSVAPLPGIVIDEDMDIDGDTDGAGQAEAFVLFDQHLLLPTMEPDIPVIPKSAQRMPEDHFDYPALEDGDVVSGPAGIISIPVVVPTGKDGHTRPQKPKISTIEQKTLVYHGMENLQVVLQ